MAKLCCCTSLVVTAVTFVLADYSGHEYWDKRYDDRGDEVYQWLQSETNIENLVWDFFTQFNVHEGMSRIVELGYGTSMMAKNVLYESKKYGPPALKNADTDPSRTVVAVDYSEVAHKKMLDRIGYKVNSETKEELSHPGLYFLFGNAYDFVDEVEKQTRSGSESSASGNHSELCEEDPSCGSKLKGYWPKNSRKVDFIFDSSVWDTLILQSVDEALKGVKPLQKMMNEDHGAWLSVSYTDPESRLYTFRNADQPWSRIIVCRPKEGGNHLFWLLRGDVWNQSKFRHGESFQAGKDGYYTCEDAEPDSKKAEL